MPPSITLEALLDQHSELSSLPEIYIKVSELLDDDHTRAAQIGEVVETDPALTSRILKMVNSAFYGFPNKIASISQAITILGRDRLRQILVGSVLSGVFGRVNNNPQFMEDFWYHSVKTAILARHLCRQTSLAEQSDTLFTAGLLHDVGRLILMQKLPDLSNEVQKAVDLEDASVFDAENKIIGFNHCQVGSSFISRWGLPPVLSETAACHHQPEMAEEFSEQTRLIHIANQLVFLVGPIAKQEVEFALEDITNWKKSGLSAVEITEACIVADEQVYEVMESLGMVSMRIDIDDD